MRTTRHAHANLHAKVYAFEDVAIVGSANVSSFSEHYLAEAALETREPSTVGACRNWVESLVGDVVEPSFAASKIAIYRTPRIPGIVTGRKTRRRSSTAGQSALWVVRLNTTNWSEADYSAEREALREGSTRIARQYQRAVRESIASFEGRLDELVRFLTKGPYEGRGPIPVDLLSERIGDDETARVINFIHCRVVSAFQGALAELLAIGPVATLVAELKDEGSLPLDARLYIGDAVMPVHPKGGTRKGADMHVLAGPESAATRTLAAVLEVKSFYRPFERLRRQLHQHVTRARDCGVVLAKGEQVSTISRTGARPVCIAVVPGTWRLSREFRFEKRGDTRRLVTVAPPAPPASVITKIRPREWHIVLGWSHESLAEAAYALTFWLMGEVGAQAFAGGTPWPEMSPEKAGQNAVKMMLYYAMLRCPTSIAEQRAIALYNTYGFGYALGMNFRRN